MNTQRVRIGGAEFQLDDARIQSALALLHDKGERPVCLCMPGGVEMYVACHRQFLVKRMPGTGKHHHPDCPSFEIDAAQSGLGELLGEAILETATGGVELRVDFPWARVQGRVVASGEVSEPGEVASAARRMSLRALTHFLFEQGGFNRWSPAMAGKRSQGVLCRHLMGSASSIFVKGRSLAERLYVPEQFIESAKADLTGRRREKLAFLNPKDGQSPLAVVLGEFKACEVTTFGRRVWIRHMPDAPLLIGEKLWERARRSYAGLFEIQDAHEARKPRLVVTALIRAKREHVYEIDALSLMLTHEQWIPVDGAHELVLVDSLIEQRRRFIKPLRYDARITAGFPNALLIDTGVRPFALHVVSAYASEKERKAKIQVLQAYDETRWVWWTEQQMPGFPPPSSLRSTDSRC